MTSEVNSKLIGDHIDGCWAREGFVNGLYPTQWNVMADFKLLKCNKSGDVVDVEETGVASYFFEINCMNDDCCAKKRISLQAFSNISCEASFTKEQVIRMVADFGIKHDTVKFLSDLPLKQAMTEVENLIDWDVNYKAR